MNDDEYRRMRAAEDPEYESTNDEDASEHTTPDEADEDDLYASEVKSTVLRLRPDFNEKTYGCATFGKLLQKLAQEEKVITVKSDNFNVLVSLNQEAAPSGKGENQLTQSNWQQAFAEQLKHYKDDGFERINPSILKEDIQSAYPDFQERSIGFKRFSDVLKELQKAGILQLESDDQKNLLIRML